ncbi:MAG: hypothetical protein KAS32_09095 [Candidatus Peribacteraceae bacterium]|nr:hypothetical protein [Candidatus Peribacteraceae bacterium]
MDKELIAMCDCSEIQYRWKPEVRDVVKCSHGIGVVSRTDTSSYKIDANKFPISAWYLNEESYGNIFIPRIENVLGWLEVHEERIGSPIAFITRTLAGGYGIDIEVDTDFKYRRLCTGDILIKALLKAFMYLEYGKEWDDDWKWNLVKQEEIMGESEDL